jgi:Reverse transcriptase (RNA-dependent DNA polymerase)
MNVPEGLDTRSYHCLQLKKAIYGLVQSAIEFSKTLILVLKSFGFKENKSDMCLLSKWHEDGVMLVGMYADGCLVMGNEEHIAKLIVDSKKNGFNLTVENSLKDYWSFPVIENKHLATSFDQ